MLFPLVTWHTKKKNELTRTHTHTQTHKWPWSAADRTKGKKMNKQKQLEMFAWLEQTNGLCCHNLLFYACTYTYRMDEFVCLNRILMFSFRMEKKEIVKYFVRAHPPGRLILMTKCCPSTHSYGIRHRVRMRERESERAHDHIRHVSI